MAGILLKSENAHADGSGSDEEMISHRYKCIFLHIPKTGGTSIESALGHWGGHVGRGGQDHRSLRTLQNPLWHLEAFASVDNLLEVARSVKYRLRKTRNPDNRNLVSKRQFQEYFKFTIIRNPWARVWSHYQGTMTDEINRQLLGITRDLSFEEFLRIFKSKGLIRPQTYWLKDYSGAIPLDFIGRFENLQADFAEACRRMGLGQIELPHKIRGTDEDYREKYDAATIRLIADTYREEIELFGYSFTG